MVPRYCKIVRITSLQSPAQRLRLLLVGGVSFSVQVVERVGLVASGFQFFSRLAAVFVQEVGGLPLHGFDFGVRPRFYFGII